MKTGGILFYLAIFSGIALFRERYFQHLRPSPASTTIDSRVKHDNRIFTLFQILTFLGGSLAPGDKINYNYIHFTIGTLSMLGSQILLEFILMIISECYVQYDLQKVNKEVFRNHNKELIKDNDVLRIKNGEYSLELESLKNEVSKNKEKIQKLENQYKDYWNLSNSLYARLDRISENEKEKKKLLTKLFNKVDENKNIIKEGDYITICDLFKNIYD